MTVHPKAEVSDSAKIGENTSIWQFATVLGGAEIGADCNVGSCAEIGSFSKIGDRVRISHGVFLPSFSVVWDDVFIGPNVTFTDDRYPRANNKDYHPEPPVIERGASIGAGATILPGVHIGQGAMIGAGAVVAKHVPPQYTVVGTPPPWTEPYQERN